MIHYRCFLQKFLVVLGCVIASISAQRPSYAGSASGGVPELASRFRTNSTDSTTSTTTTTTASGIANRAGVTDNAASSTTSRIPIDARGDADLVKRISQWPRENQPFWFVNSEHIEKHRNPQGASSGSNTVSSLLFHMANYAGFPFQKF